MSTTPNEKSELQSLMDAFLPDLNETARNRLILFADRLEETNKQFNLTALTDPRDVVLLHFYDALTLLRTGLFLPGKTVIDIGTGAGIPAFPLAACSECAVTANDATAKKLGFLSDVAAEAGLKNLRTLNGRAEELSRDPKYRESYDIAVSRGVARLNVLLEWCLPLVRPNGYFVAMKGSGGPEELREAEHALAELGGTCETVLECPIPEADRLHTLIVIKKTGRTDPKYPRPNGRIKKKPL